MRSRCALPPSALPAIMIAGVIGTTITATGLPIAIAITASVATAGFAVIGLRGSRRSRGRARAAIAVDATVTALDTSSLRSVADKAHSSAVVAPIHRPRRLRLPIENPVRFGFVSTAEPAIPHTPRIRDAR